ncbi:hypothetical protein Metev_1243 [Methanohalobium evestigatum Z-7303]|uniref:Sulfotransferase domain-containing protein n=1 Tax=Methanohalobium evestigatum (strain ATCC BAA-1072 / DSM 3721 / NBRC 107634 / OCM 161 / Z-7303) TaxID=644295 RepID=D7E7N9_METEZ|nr:hypothetical protein [Methanohalobium evestigatum]ADI74112.1 hypothetical protein Metev_1243 [Methanohalobium evestigatum Z-7303]
MNKKCLILLIGPESTSTRLFTEIFSQHPDILGTENATTHVDHMDQVWDLVENDCITDASEILPINTEHKYILTRRSIPHGKDNKPAEYMKFPNLENFYETCQLKNLPLILLITTRSVVPNLISWTYERASSNGLFENSKNQYWESYKYLFSIINKYNIPFYFVSLEALIYEEQNYINSIFQLLGLSHFQLNKELRKDVNTNRYKLFLKNFLDKKQSKHIGINKFIKQIIRK